MWITRRNNALWTKLAPIEHTFEHGVGVSHSTPQAHKFLATHLAQATAVATGGWHIEFLAERTPHRARLHASFERLVWGHAKLT